MSEAPKEIFVNWPQENGTGLAFSKPTDHRHSYTLTSHALAMVAAAYEDAAEVVAHDYVCDAIRARTPDHAQAALDALLQAERVKALREAAEIVRGLAPTIEHDSTQDDRMHESILERAARHIERAVE